MKKKGFIGLSTLLLVFLLGLSTTSYASNFTETEFSNLIANILTNFGERDISETIVTNLNNTSIVTTLLDLQDSYEYLYINEYGLPTNRIDFYFSNDDSTYVYKSGAYFYFKGNGRYSISINSSTGVFSTPYSNLSSTISNQNVQYLIYSDRDIYNNSSGTTKLYDRGFLNNEIDWLDDIFFPEAPSHELIRFAPIPKLQDVYVGQNLDIYTYGVNQNNTYRSMKFGDLYVPSGYYITRVDSSYLYFERASETWKEKLLLQEVGSDLTLSNYSYTITNFKWENYDSSTYTIDYSAWINREYLHANCMYTFTFSGYYLDESDPFYIEYIFYIIDGNTVLTGTLGDELDPSFLITGPYADEYAGDIDDLNDKVDDNADLVDAIGQGIGGTFLPASRRLVSFKQFIFWRFTTWNCSIMGL